MVCQMYDLVNMYSVPTPPEDLVVFTSMQTHISSLQNAVSGAQLQRDSIIDKFRNSLLKDVEVLNCDIMKIKLKSLVYGGC